MQMPMSRDAKPERSTPPMMPDVVKQMDPECQEVYLQTYDECSQTGAEDRRCMMAAVQAAMEHQNSYDEEEGDLPPEDDEDEL